MSSLIADVCKIVSVEKHPNADKLDLVQVKGWTCIVGRGNYKVGDLVIYCPPDSIIPDNIIEQYNLEFLKKNGRVGTIKLRKYISQGLILNIPEDKNWKEGKEVSKELGITKYEPPISCNLQGKPRETIIQVFNKYKEGKISMHRFIFKSLGIIKDKFKKKKNPNPLFNKYTDIENIKNYNTIFKEGELVVITEKIHGTNFRAGNLPRYKNNLLGKILSFFFGEYEFVYGSHNIQKTVTNVKMGFYGEDVYGQIAKKYNLKEIIPKDYIIYGEIYGRGIQDLEYGMKDIDVMFFDVKYKGKYLGWHDFLDFCLKQQLPIVPILAFEKYSDKLLKEMTEDKSKFCPNQIREGCVVKSLKEENNIRIGRKILKSINPEYLCSKNRTDYH